MDVEQFRALHVPGTPLLLANAWDLASARYLHDSGFGVIGTTSAGVAYAANKPDAHGATLAENLALATACRAAGIPLSVDLESGFSDEPATAAAHASAFAELGVLGINLEDGRPDGTLAPIEEAVAKLEAVVAAVPNVFVNARTDAFWLGRADDEGRLPVALERALAYRDAGADGIFVPGIRDAGAISTIVEAVSAPVNVLFQPDGLTFAQLAELGVGRVSCGSLLFRLALGSIVEAAQHVRDSRFQAAPTTPSYADLND